MGIENRKLSWNAPICVACWNAQEPERPAQPSIGSPMYVSGAVRRCAWCGGGTTSGILRRQDPAEVPFPAIEVDSGDELAPVGIEVDEALLLELQP